MHRRVDLRKSKSRAGGNRSRSARLSRRPTRRVTRVGVVYVCACVAALKNRRPDRVRD